MKSVQKVEIATLTKQLENPITRRVKGCKTFHTTHRTYYEELMRRVEMAWKLPSSFKLELLTFYITNRFLKLPGDAQALSELKLVLGQTPVAYGNTKFACEERDGTLFYAMQTISNRYFRFILLKTPEELSSISMEVLRLVSQFPLFGPTFFSEFYSGFPIAIPFEPPKFAAIASYTTENVRNCGMFVGHMYVNCITVDDSKFYPWNAKTALDHISLYIERFIEFIETAPPVAFLPFIFLQEFLKILEPRIIYHCRKPDNRKLITSLLQISGRCKSAYHGAAPVITFLEEFITKLDNEVTEKKN